MPLILSLAICESSVIGAGPEGLFVLRDHALHPIPQPMTSLYACAVVGDRLLAAGAPFGVASRLVDDHDPLASADRQWQGGWMDHTTSPTLTLALMPAAQGETPVLLAGTAGDGILRSTNRGINWTLCNFGLQEYVILSLAWGPRPTGRHWLERQVAFAGSEATLYRSPAAGLAWKRVDHAPADAVQAIAVSPNFHQDALVVVGTESQGIWRSHDGGRNFDPVADTPQRIDALIATANGFYAGTPEGILHSADGDAWTLLPNSPATLALLASEGKLYVGNELGITSLSM